MKLLAIEASTMLLSLAVYDGKKLLGEHNSVSHKTMSATIMTKIDKLLTKTKSSLSDIDGFVIGLGPGSFTSLRVGLSTVKALALATGKPIVGVPSADAIAFGLNKDGEICVMTDAKRSMVYASFYQKKGEELLVKQAYQLGKVEEFLPSLKKEMYVIGDGTQVFSKEIAAYLKKKKLKVHFADEKLSQARAKDLAKLSWERFAQKQFDHPSKIVPLYLYPENCQIGKK